MTNWHEVLGIVAGVIWILSLIPYIHSAVRGTTRFSSISCTLWFLLGLIEIAAQWSAGASWSLIMMIVLAFNIGVIMIFSWIGYGYKKTHWSDYVCVVFAILALVLWYYTDNPLVALVLSVIANALAAIPTLTKTYRDPHTESAIMWLVVSGASVLGILSTEIWDVANLLAPVYTLIECISIWALAYFGQRVMRA
jgi:hypothetical protein